MKDSRFLMIGLIIMVLTNLIFWLNHQKQLSQLGRQLDRSEVSNGELFEAYDRTKLQWARTAGFAVANIPECYRSKLGQEPKLVIRLSGQHCSSCVDQLVFEIKSQIHQFKQQQLTVLYSQKTNEELHLKNLKTVLQPTRFIEINDDQAFGGFDQIGLPYLALYKDGMLLSPFVPYPSNEEYLKNYLCTMAKTLRKNEK